MSNATDIIEHGGTTTSVEDGAVRSYQTEEESHVDYSRFVFMIVCLAALIMIVTIVVPYARAMRRLRAAASLATRDGQVLGTAARLQRSKDDAEEPPVEMKTEDNIFVEQEQQGGQIEAEVPHRQPPTEKMPKVTLAVGLMALLIALYFSVATHTSCRYISSSGSPGVKFLRYSDNRVVEVRTFGLWSLAIYDGSDGSANQCQSILSISFPIDGIFIFARVAAVVASVLGSIALIATLCYALSGTLDSPGFHKISWALSSATFAQALVVVIQSTAMCDSGDVCELDKGSFFSIAASVYWFIAGLSIIFVHFEIISKTILAASAN